MRVVVQRVTKAKVEVEEKIVSQIDNGYLLLVGFTHEDTIKEVGKMARKIANLRIFSDSNDKINLNIEQVNGKILSISQFTLYGSLKKSNRPSFTKAKNYQEANELYLKFNELLRKSHGIETLEGVFGENMQVHLINDGPVTIIMDSDDF